MKPIKQSGVENINDEWILFRDPLTVIYENIITSSGDDAICDNENPLDAGTVDATPDNPVRGATSNSRYNSGREAGKLETHAAMYYIFVIHTISMVFAMAVWFPSTYFRFTSGNKHSVWAMGTIILMQGSAAMFATLAACMVLHSMTGTIICMSMHLVVHFLYTLIYTLKMSVDPPMFMPSLCCVWYHIGIGTILLYTSHVTTPPLVSYTTSEYYMSHMWGIILVELVKVFLYRPMIWMLL